MEELIEQEEKDEMDNKGGGEGVGANSYPSLVRKKRRRMKWRRREMKKRRRRMRRSKEEDSIQGRRGYLRL